MSNKYIFVFRVLFFGSMLALWGKLGAQAFDAAYFNKKYPNESFVCLNRTDKAVISVVKGNLTVLQHHHEELLILKNNLSSVRSKKIRTNAMVSVKNVAANIRIYNGKSHHKEKLGTIELASENDMDGTFYDDAKYYTIKFLNAAENDIIEIDYDEEYNEARFFDAFYISDYFPVLHSALSLNYPTQLVNLKIKEINNQGLPMAVRADSSKKIRTLSWSFDSVPPVTDEPMDAGYRYKTSYILMAIESYKSGDSLIQLGGSLKNLYSWYRQLIKNVDLSSDPYLVALTDSLVKGKKNDLDKLKTIFYWVQNKIAYLAYEDGLGGYIPREATVVCKRRFGDCKDMANLVVKMGQTAGLPVYPAWIGTRDIPYQFSEFPAPFCANHMIAVYILNKDTIFLDATGKKHPFRLPTAMIQGKEALVGIDEQHYLLAKVPFTGKEATVERDSVILHLQPGNLIRGEGYYELTGYQKIYVANYLEKKSYNLQKNYLHDLLEKGNNKFRLDTFFILQDDIEKPFVLKYAFTIRDYFTQNANLTFINMNFLKDDLDWINLAKRKNIIDFSYKNINRLSVTLQLDATHKADFIPEDFSYSNEVLGFATTYKTSATSIRLTSSIFVNKSALQASDFKDLDLTVSKYKKNKSNLVSLLIK